jgi:hypothetical protein
MTRCAEIEGNQRWEFSAYRYQPAYSVSLSALRFWPAASKNLHHLKYLTP